MSGRLVLAADGGNSKTDLALVDADGGLLAFVRGPLSSPHHLGFNGSVQVLQAMFDEAVRAAHLRARDARGDGRGDGRAIAEVGQILLAGLDYPAEEQRLADVLRPLGWARRIAVGNDTFAVLRAGTDLRWGIAITCGAGINCVGIAPDGRVARFPSVGAITGDWGGGHDVGIAALAAAVRSEDGRGPRTRLQTVVPAYFGFPTPLELAEAIHTGTISIRRLGELAPTVFGEADRDPVASAIVDRLASEIVAYARAALTRLDLTTRSTEVILGGGLMDAAHGRLVDATRSGLAELGFAGIVRRAESPPIVGAALLGLDDLGAGPEAQARVRDELGAAVAGQRGPGQLVGVSTATTEGSSDG